MRQARGVENPFPAGHGNHHDYDLVSGGVASRWKSERGPGTLHTSNHFASKYTDLCLVHFGKGRTFSPC